MYHFIKKIFKTIIPNNLGAILHIPIRKIVYLFYKGDKYECNLCNKNLRKFIETEDENTICPYCGSMSRTRRIYQLLDRDLLKYGQSVLDFSPQKSFFQKLKQRKNIHYIATDYVGEFDADYHLDITKLDLESDSMDIIICYHILEHIIEDHKAMQELYRVLKSTGIAIIQTPYHPTSHQEDPMIISAADRLQHYGQRDHVRIYSVASLKDRLHDVGFHIDIKYYHNENSDNHDLKKTETILICTK